jgi:hypothetical protein
MGVSLIDCFFFAWIMLVLSLIILLLEARKP